LWIEFNPEIVRSLVFVRNQHVPTSDDAASTLGNFGNFIDSLRSHNSANINAGK